jgi:hypothetical protein
MVLKLEVLFRRTTENMMIRWRGVLEIARIINFSDDEGQLIKQYE